jgi:hypothetical protein
MNKTLFWAGVLVSLIACQSERPQDQKARDIIAQCVKQHGGDSYQNFDIAFDFRKFRVRIQQNGVQYRYERVTKDTLNKEIKDVLTNEAFVREINGKKQELSAKDESRYREGTNSIAYFVLLPFKLTDPAVNAQHLGTVTIAGQTYDKIKIWFEAEGGGKDHEDVFCYWVNQKTQMLDYLSYANGGPRFRKATKRETVAGIVFQDYENYEVLDTTLTTSDYDAAFEAGKAKLLSKIEQTNYADMRQK